MTSLEAVSGGRTYDLTVGDSMHSPSLSAGHTVSCLSGALIPWFDRAK